MSILLATRPDRMARWTAALKAAMPNEAVCVWPDTGDARAVEVIVTGEPLPAPTDCFPSLRFIAATGAGVDRLLSAGVPEHVPVVRLADDQLTSSMADYVLTAVLRYYRQFDQYEIAQRQSRWQPLPRPEPADTRVSLLGLGVLGRSAADRLLPLGFPVAGWRRSAAGVPGIRTFHGQEGIDRMLASTDILVCLLPLTDDTRGLVNADLLARLPRGARFINVGRGGHVVEADLLAALDSGQISHATLDVTANEPLPSDHPFWLHPRVTLTPHIASLTVPETAARTIAANLNRMRRGEPPGPLVDRGSGY